MFAYALASTLCSEATNIAYCLSLAVGAKSELMLENLGIHQSKFKLRMSSLDAVKRSIFIDYRGGGFVCLFFKLYKSELLYIGDKISYNDIKYYFAFLQKDRESGV